MSNDALFTLHERERANRESWGKKSKRIGGKSALPFGHCALSLVATEGDAVATPSGHIYRKEAMLEYLLAHKQSFDNQEEEASLEERRKDVEREKRRKKGEAAEAERFKEESDRIKLRDADGAVDRKRKRDIDGSSKSDRVEALSKSSPWLPTFTPSLGEDNGGGKSKKSKRAASPCTGLPIRAKDLIPLNLTRSGDGKDKKYLCAVSKKVITNQNVVVLKNTHTVMLEEVAKELAFPSSICPLTGKSFSKKDVVHLQKAQSSFAASGAKETTVTRHTLL